MLAFGQHNLGLCGGPKIPKLGLQPSVGAFCQVLGPSAQLCVLPPSFGAFSPVLGPSAHFQTHTQTFHKYILV